MTILGDFKQQSVKPRDTLFGLEGRDFKYLEVRFRARFLLPADWLKRLHCNQR